jgi:tRNA N6-adenosine threonylcarbamoyltransferase
MLVLGIETTCDETAAAVVSRDEDGRGEILSNVVLSQTEHETYGGVVPEIAARAHVEALDTIITRAMMDANLSFNSLDGIAAAAGPGLIGGVIVGLTTAKAIALVREKPLIAVNHLEAHALTARLTDNTEFPYCLFLASGGHTQIVAVLDVGKYVRLGTTLDDAIGEAFDKTAKLLGLGYPGGPEVEGEAKHGDAERFILPRPMLGRAEADFSLSGLKTALRMEAEKVAPLSDQDVADLCAAFQAAVVDVVSDRMCRPAHLSRALRRADRAGGRRRRCGEPVDPARARPRGIRAGDRAGRATAGALHRQRRDDRVGRRRAARARHDRHARLRSAGALAARRRQRIAAARCGEISA